MQIMRLSILSFVLSIFLFYLVRLQLYFSTEKESNHLLLLEDSDGGQVVARLDNLAPGKVSSVRMQMPIIRWTTIKIWLKIE